LIEIISNEDKGASEIKKNSSNFLIFINNQAFFSNIKGIHVI